MPEEHNEPVQIGNIAAGGPRIRINQGIPSFGGPGGSIADLLNEIGAGDESEYKDDGDYVEEKTTKDGRHIHKEVHK